MTVYSIGGGGMVVDIDTAETLARTDPIALAVRKAMESTTPEQQAEIDEYFNEEDFGPFIVNALTMRYDPSIHAALVDAANNPMQFDEEIAPGLSSQMHEDAIRALAEYENRFVDEIMRRNESEHG